MKKKVTYLYKDLLSNFPTVIVLLYWGFQCLMKGFALEKNDIFFKIGILLLVPLIIFKILSTNYSFLEFVFYCIIGITAIINYLVVGNSKLIIIVLTLLIFIEVDLNLIFEWMWKIRGFAFIANIGLCLLNIKNVNKIFVVNENRVRYTFGFSHANLAHAEFFIIISSYIFYRKGKLKIIDYLIIEFANLLLFNFTDSRTGFLLITFLLIFNYFFSNFYVSKYLNIMLPYTFIIVTCIVFLILKFVDDQLVPGVLWTFYSRFYTSRILIGMSSIRLFGNPIIFNTDLGYVNLLYNYGLIFFILFILAHSYLLKIYCQNKSYYIVAYLLIISIYFVLEYYSINVLYNLTWLLLSKTLHEKLKQDKKVNILNTIKKVRKRDEVLY